MEPQEEAYVDTALSAYAEAGIRVVFALAARDRGALDIAPFIAKNLPELTATGRSQKNASVRISMLSRGRASGAEVGSWNAVWAVQRARPSASNS